MKYVEIIIENERLIFKYKIKKFKNQNTLKILSYKLDFLKENINTIIDTIINYINENELSISTGLIYNIELIDISLDIIRKIKTINSLIIYENEILNDEICKKLYKTKNIKNLECYDVDEHMLDRLEDKGIKVNLKTEILNISNFVFDNKLNLYDDIFYRERVLFKSDIDNKDITGFSEFCKINKYLNQIDIFAKFTIDDLKQIIDILIENNLTNVDINIYPEIIGVDEINNIIRELKSLNRKTKKEKKIKISAKYTNLYKRRNFLKQINFYNFKTVIAIAIVLSFSILAFLSYYAFETYRGVNDVKKESKNFINKDEKIDEYKEDVEKKEEVTPELPKEETKEEGTYNPPPIENDFSKLIQINSDTVGWLTVKNTHVDYPVVKGADNDYYLNKNFYKRTTGSGWIYMDYRNNIDILDRNTIIYGHSGLKDKTLMFASLLNTLNEDWYINKDNQIISFNSINANMNWQIFSIYTIDPSYNFIQTQFLNDNEFLNFIGEITNKSIYDFGVSVDERDKLLTLSTCYDKGNERLVIHAKLLK